MLQFQLKNKKLAYGSGEIIAYVVVLDTITENVTYYTGATFEVSFNGVPPYPFYATRSIVNVPINFYSNKTTQAPLIQYTGNDILKQTTILDNGLYVTVTPVDTGGTPLPTYDLKRGIMNGAADNKIPIVGSTVPYMKPIIDNDESTYVINNTELKMAYASLVPTPRAANFNVIGQGQITIEAKMDTSLDDGGDYKPAHYYSGNISTINKFSKYTNLAITKLTLNTANETWIHGDKVELKWFVQKY